MHSRQSSYSKISLQELTWQQVRQDVSVKNPELAAAIDSVNPDKTHTFFKLTSPYGTEIMKGGKLYLPNSHGEMVLWNDENIDTHIKESLAYNFGSNPVTLVLKNTVELFLDLQDRIIPFYGLVAPGQIFGLWRVLSQHAPYKPDEIWDTFDWGMTAGARSVFMLPKITEVERHKRLKRLYQISSDVPKCLTEHWQIFKELANHKDFPEQWETEILFFSNKWFTHFNDPAWIDFNYYLYRKAWLGSEAWRNEGFWNLKLSFFHKKQSVKANAVITDTAKYLLGMGVGNCPGFAPAIDNTALPLEGIQAIYADDYNLKEYAPIIMRPQSFTKIDTQQYPIYYSLLHPVVMSYSQNIKEKVSFITDLYEIKSLVNKYLLGLAADQADVKYSPLYRLNNTTKFDYFHANSNEQGDIKESKEIAEDDHRFLTIIKHTKGKKFPENATFIKCCVRLVKNAKSD